MTEGKVLREIAVGNAPYGVVADRPQGVCEQLGRAASRK